MTMDLAKLERQGNSPNTMEQVFDKIQDLREYVCSVRMQSELSIQIEACWALGWREEERQGRGDEGMRELVRKQNFQGYADVMPAVKEGLSRAYACVGGGDRSLPYAQYLKLVRACRECGVLAGDAHMGMTHMEAQTAYERMAAETASGYAHTHEHTAHTPESRQRKRADEAEARIQRMLKALAKIIKELGEV